MDKHRKGPASDKSKKHLRRMKANFRERNRMHGLNDAMDILRKLMPLHFHLSRHQKLSKIETLRLARNYILVLDRMLADNQNGCDSDQAQIGGMEYAEMLTRGLSATTSNLIACLLNVPPRHLAAVHRGYASDSGQSFASGCSSDHSSGGSEKSPLLSSAVDDQQLIETRIQPMGQVHKLAHTTTTAIDHHHHPQNQQFTLSSNTFYLS